jgi:hypothetical protein
MLKQRSFLFYISSNYDGTNMGIFIDEEKCFGIVNLDTQRLQIIRGSFNKICEERALDDDDLKNKYIEKIVSDLGLIEDQTSLDYLNICVSESSEQVATVKIKDKLKINNEIFQLISPDEGQADPIVSSNIPSNPVEPSQQVQEQKISSLNKIICIIHQKSIKIEIDTFFHEFLFRQADQKSR